MDDYNISMNDKNNELNIGISDMKQYAKVLHCPKRWAIINIINRAGEITTSRISDNLSRESGEVSIQSLYYHLSELKDAGIIGLAGYEEKQQGAPEKIWELRAKEININLINKQEVRDDM